MSRNTWAILHIPSGEYFKYCYINGNKVSLNPYTFELKRNARSYLYCWIRLEYYFSEFLSDKTLKYPVNIKEVEIIKLPTTKRKQKNA